MACCHRVAWCVCMSVGRLCVAILSSAKAAEPIDMPFVLWIWVGPRNHVLHGATDTPCEGQFSQGKRYLHG